MIDDVMSAIRGLTPYQLRKVYELIRSFEGPRRSWADTDAHRRVEHQDYYGGCVPGNCWSADRE
mgnify:CR=1 FL=1